MAVKQTRRKKRLVGIPATFPKSGDSVQWGGGEVLYGKTSPPFIPCQDIQLDDDTLLGGVQLTDADGVHLPPLSPLQQAMVLAQW